MSAPSPKTSFWHGIARETIPWFLTVNHDKSIGCELCVVTCGRGALEKTPSHMNFEVTSTGQQDIQNFLEEVRGLIRDNRPGADQ